MSDSIVSKVQDAELENPRSHKCAEMPSTGVHVQYGRNLLGRPLCWSLYLIREATEEDLEENHLLEEVGIQFGRCTMKFRIVPIADFS